MIKNNSRRQERISPPAFCKKYFYKCSSVENHDFFSLGSFYDSLLFLIYLKANAMTVKIKLNPKYIMAGFYYTQDCNYLFKE